jgi:TM2 domain-containing membrane protein YozV
VHRIDTLMAPAQARPRNPTLAASLCAIPGLGQLYNRQPGKAVFFLLTVLLTIGPAVLLITNGEHIGTRLITDQQGSLFLLFAFGSILVFLGLFLLGLTFWASSVIDARRSALEYNQGESGAAGRWWLLRL